MSDFKDDIEEMRERADWETYHEKCRTCPWSKHCIEPPQMTEEEVNEQIEDLAEGENPEEGLIGSMLGSVALAGRDQNMPGCEVFRERVKHDEKFVKKIKKVMQGRAVIIEKEED